MTISHISLKDASGRAVLLSEFAGKPSLLIVESVEVIAQNIGFKQQIRQAATARPDLASKMGLIAVADLSGVSGFGMSIAMSAVSAASSKDPNVRILVDNDGIVNAELRLDPRKSNVVVLDGALNPVMGLSGQLTLKQGEAIINKLVQMVGG